MPRPCGVAKNRRLSAVKWLKIARVLHDGNTRGQRNCELVTACKRYCRRRHTASRSYRQARLHIRRATVGQTGCQRDESVRIHCVSHRGPGRGIGRLIANNEGSDARVGCRDRKRLACAIGV